MCQGQVRMSFKSSSPRSRVRLTHDLPPQVCVGWKHTMAFSNEGAFLGRLKDEGPSWGKPFWGCDGFLGKVWKRYNCDLNLLSGFQVAGNLLSHNCLITMEPLIQARNSSLPTFLSTSECVANSNQLLFLFSHLESVLGAGNCYLTKSVPSVTMSRTRLEAGWRVFQHSEKLPLVAYSLVYLQVMLPRTFQMSFQTPSFS